MFVTIKGYCINTQNITYITVNDNEVTINFAGSSDNYLKIELDNKEQVRRVQVNLSSGKML